MVEGKDIDIISLQRQCPSGISDKRCQCCVSNLDAIALQRQVTTCRQLPLKRQSVSVETQILTR